MTTNKRNINKRNRTYTTKYDNETYKFFTKISGDETFQELARKINTRYINIYYSFKKNRIPGKIARQILKKLDLTETEKAELKNLVLN